MENLEIQEKVINLGKKLLSNLKDNNADEITAWMVNYIAELMIKAESGNEADKTNCFNTILKLWENRKLLPDGTRPFESFEPIFQALESLNPESVIPRYFINLDDDESDKKLDESAGWLELIKNLDSATRTLITFMFERAIEDITNEETKEWLEAVSGTVKSIELEIIFSHIHSKETNEKEERMQKLENRINQLKFFEELCLPVREKLEEELKILNKSYDI